MCSVSVKTEVKTEPESLDIFENISTCQSPTVLSPTYRITGNESKGVNNFQNQTNQINWIATTNQIPFSNNLNQPFGNIKVQYQSSPVQSSLV